MGQKVNPKAFRLGVTIESDSKWFAPKDYKDFLQQDEKIRKFLIGKIKEAGYNKIEIERSANTLKIIIHVVKTGIVIGRGGQGVEELKKYIKENILKKNKKTARLNPEIVVQGVERPSLCAQVVLLQIIADLEKRIPFRRVMKQAVGRVERAGAQGVKVIVSGRLNGAEIARSERLAVGKIPLHTLRADVDYARGAAGTIYGAIGVKVWIYRGEVFEKQEEPVTKQYAKR